MNRGPLREMNPGIVQQCIHCGLCLPSCPTYDATKIERNSPRGRIALMRAIGEGALDPSRAFGEEMSFCLGCLACQSACPAGVDYLQLFEAAREEVERSQVLATPGRRAMRKLVLEGLFFHPRLLRMAGRALRVFQSRLSRLLVRRFLPGRLRDLEEMAPAICARFSHQLIAPIERPSGPARFRVALLTGCVQDLAFAQVNRDTVDALLANDCEVHTPAVQPCCGSLHIHNGEAEMARELARRQVEMLPPAKFDAIISNAAGCGSHLKHFDRLLAGGDSAQQARAWAAKVRDIHEWLCEIDFRAPVRPPQGVGNGVVTYHEACHLCHGQGISEPPRRILRAIPGIRLVELPEATWCCGSAGIYNITQPEMAAALQNRKLRHIEETGAAVVATANPGCQIQIAAGIRRRGGEVAVCHPITLLANAYRAGR